MEAYLLEIKNEQWYDSGNAGIDSYIAAPLLDVKYEQADVDQVVVENCAHLNSSQQKDLANLLRKHE